MRPSWHLEDLAARERELRDAAERTRLERSRHEPETEPRRWLRRPAPR